MAKLAELVSTAQMWFHLGSEVDDGIPVEIVSGAGSFLQRLAP